LRPFPSCDFQNGSTRFLRWLYFLGSNPHRQFTSVSLPLPPPPPPQLAESVFKRGFPQARTFPNLPFPDLARLVLCYPLHMEFLPTSFSNWQGPASPDWASPFPSGYESGCPPGISILPCLFQRTHNFFFTPPPLAQASPRILHDYSLVISTALFARFFLPLWQHILPYRSCAPPPSSLTLISIPCRAA